MKNKKMWLEASLICIIVGVVLLTAGRFMGGIPGFSIDRQGFHAAGDEEYPEPLKGEMALEEFDSIELDVDYADVELVVSDRFAVEYCLAGGSKKPVCKVKNGKFTFIEGDYFRIVNFNFFTSGRDSSDAHYFVRVEIPRDVTLSKVSMKTEFGDFDIGTLKAGRMELENEYGDIEMKAAEGRSLRVTLDSGNLTVSRLAVSETRIENEYGNVDLTAAGDEKEYALDLCTEYGSIRAGGTEKHEDEYSDEIHYESDGDGKKRIEVYCEMGDINIDSET